MNKQNQFQQFQENCLKAQENAENLLETWRQIRDYCVNQENRTDLPDNQVDGHTDYLNDQIYFKMYGPYNKLMSILEMLEETGTREWLEDCRQGYIPNSDPSNNTLNQN
jgi:hypothetical protein